MIHISTHEPGLGQPYPVPVKNMAWPKTAPHNVIILKGKDPLVLSYRPGLISSEPLCISSSLTQRSKQSADGVIRTPNVIKYLARLVWVGPPEAVSVISCGYSSATGFRATRWDQDFPGHAFFPALLFWVTPALSVPTWAFPSLQPPGNMGKARCWAFWIFCQATP